MSTTPLTAPEISHVMLDIETLGADPFCPILAIGAVGFNMALDDTAQELFYAPIRLQSCLDLGLRPSGATINWWMQRDEAARAVFNDPNAVDLPTALGMFTTFINSRPLQLWGNSARFDMGILEAAYRSCRMQVPWEHWNERCYRTIKNIPKAKEVTLQRQGTYHNALDDAMSQADHLKQINAALQLQL